jgi:outer membrane lipoprotein carrier protein
MEQSKTILELITGRINLKNKFNIIKDEDSTQPLKYKLIPKNPEPNMVLVYIWLNKNNLIKKINIIDFFGNENIITFENTIINPKIEDNLFWETPPEDVEVLEGRPK